MPKIRRLTGTQVIAILESFGFYLLRQTRNHVKLGRLSCDGTKEEITLPPGDELDEATLRAILRQAGRFVPERELKPHFYP